MALYKIGAAGALFPNDAAPYRPAKATHRYKSGETVISPSPAVPPGPYVIVRLLPLVHGEPHYRVKSTVDKHERALLEGADLADIPGARE